MSKPADDLMRTDASEESGDQDSVDHPDDADIDDESGVDLSNS